MGSNFNQIECKKFHKSQNNYYKNRNQQEFIQGFESIEEV
jgi:hypothetical protein